MNYSLNSLYKVIKTSRQAFHSKVDRFLMKEGELQQLRLIMDEFREDHPGMSLRDAYYVLQPSCIGRDKFEAYFQSYGYGVGIKRSFRRTTNSNGVVRFPNLIEGIELTHVNQVWVSDITYFQVGTIFYYLTFIMDMFSRRILGYNASKTLITEHTTIPALLMAFELRLRVKVPGLIIHSDGGGQYYSKEFRKLTEAAEMLNSMGKTAIDNPHAERVNGIIKNNYLKHYNPNSFKELRIMLTKAVKMYNEQKPHSALKRLTPTEFETKNVEIENNSSSYFPNSTLYDDDNFNKFENKMLTSKPVNVI